MNEQWNQIAVVIILLTMIIATSLTSAGDRAKCNMVISNLKSEIALKDKLIERQKMMILHLERE